MCTASPPLKMLGRLSTRRATAKGVRHGKAKGLFHKHEHFLSGRDSESRRPSPKFLSAVSGRRKAWSLKKNEIFRLDDEDSRDCAEIKLSG